MKEKQHLNDRIDKQHDIVASLLIISKWILSKTTICDQDGFLFIFFLKVTYFEKVDE